MSMGYTVTPESQLKDLGDFEFPEVVKQRTQEELKCSDEELEAVTISLLNYFAVVKDEANVEMVDEKADVLWHTLLLDTKAYMDLCSNYVGFYVHHNPYVSKKAVSTKAKDSLVVNYETSRARHPRLNRRYSNYVDRHSDDDTLMNLMFFYMIASCSNCTSSTDEVAESICTSSPESTYDSVDRFNDTLIDTTPAPEPEPSRSSCGSAPSSSCSSSSCSSSKSSCSSSSSSSCSSSSSSSCGSSCGS